MEGPTRQKRRSSGFRSPRLLPLYTPRKAGPRRETHDPTRPPPVSSHRRRTPFVRRLVPDQIPRSGGASRQPSPLAPRKCRIRSRTVSAESSKSLGLRKQQHCLPLQQPLGRIHDTHTTPTWPLVRRSSAATPERTQRGGQTAGLAPRATCPT